MGGENSYIIGSANGVKVFRRGIFIALYFIAIIYITILSRSAYLNLNVRLIPFQSYYEWILGNWNRGSSILLNIVLFVPFGYLITEESSWRRVICECLGASVVIEIIQLITMHGICEVDDLFSNMFGGYLGYITYQIVNKKIAEKFVKYMPHLMLLAGLIGCFIASGNTQVYETQFDFRVFRIIASGDQLNLEGICKVYNRDNLPYQILLKSPDNERILSVVITEDNFSATVTDENGELYVRFRGYKPIATGVYLENGEIEYVEPGTPRPDITDTWIEQTIDNGTLLVYNAAYDVYVYQLDKRLYWLIGEESDSSVIYHLYTDEPDNLPDNRQQYGFDNRGFKAGSEKELKRCGKYQVFSDIIPSEYNVTAIATGMNDGSDVKWREYFRPLKTDGQ